MTKFDERIPEKRLMQATLGPPELDLPHVIAMSLATNAPVFGAVTFVPLMAGAAGGNGAGSALPLSIILSAVASFGIAWTLARFSRKVDVTGSVYAYISRSLGDRLGTAIGSLNYLSVVFVPLTPLIFGGYLQAYLLDRFGVDLPYWALSLGFVAVVGVMVALGVSFSTRVQLVWTLGAVAVIAVFSTVVIVRGISSGAASAGAPFDAGSAPNGWLGVLWGTLYGGFIFAGFESAQNLAEETRNPRRMIPLGMMVTICVLAVYFLLVGYSTVIGFAMDGAAIGQDSAPMLTLAGGAYGAPWLRDLMTIMLLVDILSMQVGVCVYGGRGVFALARDGRLPAILTRVSKKRRVPVFVSVVQVSWMALLVIATHFVIGPLLSSDGAPEYQGVFVWTAGFISLITVIMYGAVCLGAFGWLRRRDSRPVLLMVAAGIGVLSVSAALCANLSQASAPTYAGAAIIVVVLGGFLIHNTIHIRRGTYVPSLVRRGGAEPATETNR